VSCPSLWPKCESHRAREIISGVADRIPERIRTLVYLDAFVPEGGECLFELHSPERAQQMRLRARTAGGRVECKSRRKHLMADVLKAFSYSLPTPATMPRPLHKHVRPLFSGGADPLHISLFIRSCQNQKPSFFKAVDSSPHIYLLNLKLERARELLKNPSMSLIDIALDCGFSSHSHMSRLFHKFVGVTPSAYRRRLRP
jgi:hypothetical protein